MSVNLLTEHNLEEVSQARLSLHLSKCHIVGNQMSRLIYIYNSVGSFLIIDSTLNYVANLSIDQQCVNKVGTGSHMCRVRTFITYEGHPINRGNFLTMQEFIPVRHHKCNHKWHYLLGMQQHIQSFVGK